MVVSIYLFTALKLIISIMCQTRDYKSIILTKDESRISKW